MSPGGFGCHPSSSRVRSLEARLSIAAKCANQLIDEGNGFEADAPAEECGGDGVAGEVRTPEVPEDDVAGEHLDRD